MKNPGTLRIKMSCLYIYKKLAVYFRIHWSHSISFIFQLVTQDDGNLAPHSFAVCHIC